MPARPYSAEEKAHLLRDFDIEVADRLQKWRKHLAAELARFPLEEENQLARLARPVRALALGAYAADPARALRGVEDARLRTASHDAVTESPRKRKYLAERDEPAARAPKTARMMPAATPKKKLAFAGIGTPTHHRPLRTPGRGVAPSPFKAPPPRPTSPSKPAWGARRPPSVATFAPDLPRLRMPRPGEALVSANGSPVANPLARPPAGAGVLALTLQSGATVELDPAQLARADLGALDLAPAERAEVAGFLAGLRAAAERWAPPP